MIQPFDMIELRTSQGGSAKLYAYGAHLVSWQVDGRECLFTSATAEFRAGAAIRGGVPLIFPQFAALGKLPKHGFARSMPWQLLQATADSTLLQLRDDAHSRLSWPHAFLARYHVVLHDDGLSMTLSVTNTDTQPYAFTVALHTYLRVADIGQVSIGGLQGLQYSNTAAGGQLETDTAPALSIQGEVDRIYFSSTQPLRVFEPGRRTLECSAQGFADTVIWNPGAEKAAALSDLEVNGYRRMVCVEAANIGAPVQLAPGATWSGTQHLHLQ